MYASQPAGTSWGGSANSTVGTPSRPLRYRDRAASTDGPPRGGRKRIPVRGRSRNRESVSRREYMVTALLPRRLRERTPGEARRTYPEYKRGKSRATLQRRESVGCCRVKT